MTKFPLRRAQALLQEAETKFVRQGFLEDDELDAEIT